MNLLIFKRGLTGVVSMLFLAACIPSFGEGPSNRDQGEQKGDKPAQGTSNWRDDPRPVLHGAIPTPPSLPDVGKPLPHLTPKIAVQPGNVESAIDVRNKDMRSPTGQTSASRAESAAKPESRPEQTAGRLNKTGPGTQGAELKGSTMGKATKAGGGRDLLPPTKKGGI